MEKERILKFLKVILVVSCMFQIASASNNTTFCASNCVDYIGACFGPGQNDCWACSPSLYLLQRNSTGYCQPKTQHQISFYELRNSGIDLTGYSTTKHVPQTCGMYSLSGQYVAGNYIQKTFTGLPLNHYQVVVRFGVGFMGTWNSTNQILAEANGQSFSWLYNSCYYP